MRAVEAGKKAPNKPPGALGTAFGGPSSSARRGTCASSRATRWQPTQALTGTCLVARARQHAHARSPSQTSTRTTASSGVDDNVATASSSPFREGHGRHRPRLRKNKPRLDERDLPETLWPILGFLHQAAHGVQTRQRLLRRRLLLALVEFDGEPTPPSLASSQTTSRARTKPTGPPGPATNLVEASRTHSRSRRRRPRRPRRPRPATRTPSRAARARGGRRAPRGRRP